MLATLYTHHLLGVVVREAVLPELVDHLVELALADVPVANKPLPPQVGRHRVINTLRSHKHTNNSGYNKSWYCTDTRLTK